MPRGVVGLHPREPRVNLTDPEPEFPSDPESARTAALAAQVIEGLHAGPS